MTDRTFKRSPKYFFIWISEGGIIFLSALAASYVRLRLYGGSPVNDYDPFLIKTGVLSVTYIASFHYFGLYAPDMYRPGRVMFIRLMKAALLAIIILFSIFYMFPSIMTWRGILLIDTMLAAPAVLLWRFAVSAVKTAELPGKRVLIIGSGDMAKKIGGQIYGHAEYGMKLVGFIDDDPSKLGVSIVNPGVVGGYGDITRISQSENIDTIIVALPDRRSKLPMSALLDCKLRGVTVEEGETFNERMTGQIPLDHLKPSWMVFSDGFKSLRSRKIIKRTFDLTLSAASLVLLSPVMLLTALLIKIESPGPVIFSQIRVGEHGREFMIYKFRSMRKDAEAASGPVWAKERDSRVTRVGRIIRKTKIDELPQIINVLKGDMSFVGPRPERPFFIKRLKGAIPYYEMRTVVKPGITGWAQIRYPYGSTVHDAVEKLQYDIYYIKNMSPLLDLMIFFLTVKAILTGKGARRSAAPPELC